jgi:hypothetical protein
LTLTCDNIGPKRPPSVLSFPNAFSNTEGNDKKRSVCPVGAVSKTITENSMDLTCLAISILHPSINSLHDFCKPHRFVHTGNGKRKILHHRSHPSALIGWNFSYMAHPVECDIQLSIISCKLPLGSISIANRLSNPFTLVASLPNFCENASDRLCAGSVDCGRQLTSALRPILAHNEEDGFSACS